MKVKFEIEYDGTEFCGWQKQNGVKTVQETLETALGKVLGATKTTLYGAGRTDTGVHAINQVAHIEIVDNSLIGKWQNQVPNMWRAINFYLHNTAVIVRSSEIVSDDFHARFSAQQRSYVYAILNAPCGSTLLKNRVWHIPQELDLNKTREAAKLLIGRHNFNAFRSSECQATNPIRTLDYVGIIKKNNFLLITVKAKSFLHNQVRIMVGTLCQIGLGKLSKENLSRALESGKRCQAGVTAPPHGLYFWKVKY